MTETVGTERVAAGLSLGRDVRSAGSYAEALRMAELDYEVCSTPLDELSVMTESGVLSSGLPGQRLLYRPDTGAGFGVVGSRYEVVQTADAFAVAANLHAGGAWFEAAGESRPGRPFLTMLIPDATVPVTEVDSVVFRIVLGADHSGSAAVTASISAERLVCTNGMTVSLPGLQTAVSIRHTAAAEARLSAAREIMLEAHRYAKSFQAVAATLIDQPMSRGEFTAWIDELYPRPDVESGTKVTRWEKRRAALLSLFTRAATQDEGRGTRWAAFNAVSEYLAWEQPVRGAQPTRSSDSPV